MAYQAQSAHIRRATRQDCLAAYENGIAEAKNYWSAVSTLIDRSEAGDDKAKLELRLLPSYKVSPLHAALGEMLTHAVATKKPCILKTSASELTSARYLDNLEINLWFVHGYFTPDARSVIFIDLGNSHEVCVRLMKPSNPKRGRSYSSLSMPLAGAQ